MKAFQDKNRFLRFWALFLLIPFYWAIYAGCMGGVSPGGGGGSSGTPVSGISNPTEGGAGGGPGGAGGPGGGGGGPGGPGVGDGGATDTAGGPSGQTGDDVAVNAVHSYVKVQVKPPSGYSRYALKKEESPGEDTDAEPPLEVYPGEKPLAELRIGGTFDGPFNGWGQNHTDGMGFATFDYPVIVRHNVCKSYVVIHADFEWKGTNYTAESCPLACPAGTSDNPYLVELELAKAGTNTGTSKRPCLPTANTNDMVKTQ